MKRLKLEDFKAKNADAFQPEKVDQLLGQVLGDCHDEEKGFFDTLVDAGEDFIDRMAKRLRLKPIE